MALVTVVTITRVTDGTRMAERLTAWINGDLGRILMLLSSTKIEQ
jgi:hypothetical protein